jgi:hypothetical protein
MITRTQASWQTALQALDFQQQRARTYQRDGFVARADRSWLVLARKARADHPFRDAADQPGLWKPVPHGAAEADHPATWEFALPLRLFQVESVPLDDSSAEDSPRAAVEWALASAPGTEPASWTPPPRATVDSWLPEAGLSLQCGPLTRHGALVHQPGRLALRFPLLHEIPRSLTPQRRAWLDRVLLDAQHRWHLVRVVMSGVAGRPAVEAEVDLTGAPAVILAELFALSLDAVRCVVSWLIWPVTFVADPEVACRAWDVSPTADVFRTEENHE